MRGSGIEIIYILQDNPKDSPSGRAEGYFCLGTIGADADAIAIQWRTNSNLGPRGNPQGTSCYTLYFFPSFLPFFVCFQIRFLLSLLSKQLDKG